MYGVTYILRRAYFPWIAQGQAAAEALVDGVPGCELKNTSVFVHLTHRQGHWEQRQ